MQVYVMPGEAIVRAGDMARELAFLAKGVMEEMRDYVMIHTMLGDARQRHEWTMLPTARATEDVTLLAVAKADYEELAAAFPEQHEAVVANLLAGLGLDADGLGAAPGSEPADSGSDLAKERVRTRRLVQAALQKRGAEARSALVWAAVTGDAEAAVALLGRGHAPDAQDYDGRTPAHLAALEGHVKLLEALLADGADPSLRDRWGHTPLQHAISKRHGPAIELLQRAGADLGFADAARPLCAAAIAGDMRLLTRLLDNGVDANARDYDGRTALHTAASRGSLKVIDYLLSCRADVNAVDMRGKTPLRYAAMEQLRADTHVQELGDVRERIAAGLRALEARGARPQYGPAAGGDGDAVFMGAAVVKTVEAVGRLQAAGADLATTLQAALAAIKPLRRTLELLLSRETTAQAAAPARRGNAAGDGADQLLRRVPSAELLSSVRRSRDVRVGATWCSTPSLRRPSGEGAVTFNRALLQLGQVKEAMEQVYAIMCECRAQPPSAVLQEILVATGLQLTLDQEKQLLSACEQPLVANRSPPSAFTSEPFTVVPPAEPAPQLPSGPQPLAGPPSRSYRASIFTPGGQPPTSLPGPPSRSYRASVFTPGGQPPPPLGGPPSRSYRASIYIPGGQALAGPAPERPYQRMSIAPRRANRASIAPGGAGGCFLALSRTTSYNVAPAAQAEPPLPISSDSDRTGSNESTTSGSGSAGVISPPGQSSVAWPGAVPASWADPVLGLGSLPGTGPGFGPVPPAEPPRVVLSLPHLLLAPVLEAALISRHAARLARLRSGGGSAGIVGGRAALGEALDAALGALTRLFSALDTERRGVLVPAKLRRDGGVMGELGAAILSTCAPAGNRRAVQELAFNKLRFIEAALTWLGVGDIVDEEVSDAGSDDSLEAPPGLLGVPAEQVHQDQPPPAMELDYGLPPSIPSSVRGQHLPLVDRFLAALAAAKAPAPRAKAPGKLVDVERMFHEADVDGNGYLESMEVGRIMARMKAGGRGVSNAEVRAVMRQVDSNNDARVGFDEFVRVMAPLLQDGPPSGRPSAVPQEDAHAPGGARQARSGVGVLLPDSWIVHFWDMAIRWLAVYYFITVPIDVAFWAKARLGAWFAALNLAADLLLMADVVLHFFRAYVSHNSVLITGLAQIRRHYLGGYFLLDLVAACPYDMLASDMDADSLRSRFRVLVPIYLGPIHILACAWWAVGTWDLPDFWSPAFHPGSPGVPATITIASWSGHSVVAAFNATAYAAQLAQHWVGLYPAYGLPNVYQEATIWEQYLVSVYWCVSTLTTNGQVGAATPQNLAEMAFTAVLMVMTVTIFNYVLGEITNVIMAQDAALVATRAQVQRVQKFVGNRQLAQALRDDVMRHMEATRSVASDPDAGEIFPRLSHILQVEVAKHMSRGLLALVPIFAGCSSPFLDSLSVLLHEVSMPPDTLLFRSGDPANELYIVAGGAVDLRFERGGDEVAEAARTVGQAVGEIGFFFCLRHIKSARTRARGHATLFAIRKAEYAALAKLYPEEEEVVTGNILAGWQGRGGAAEFIGVLAQARARRREERVVDAALSMGGVEADDGDFHGRTALHLAASNGHLATVRRLVLGHGAGVNVTDRYGGTPALDAVRHRHADVLAFLRAHGARLPAERVKGDLFRAAAEGDEAFVELLVGSGGVLPNAADYHGRTALHLATANAHLSIVQFLVAQPGIEVNAEDSTGSTPLADAIRYGHHEEQAALRGAGGRLGASDIAERLCVLAENGVDMGACDADGCTALHVAAACGRAEAACLLLSLPGADELWQEQDAERRARRVARAVAVAPEAAQAGALAALAADVAGGLPELELHCAVATWMLQEAASLVVTGARWSAAQDELQALLAKAARAATGALAALAAALGNGQAPGLLQHRLARAACGGLASLAEEAARAASAVPPLLERALAAGRANGFYFEVAAIDKVDSDCSTSGTPCRASEPLNGADASHTRDSEKKVLNKIFWHLVPIHWGIILWTYFDRSSLSFAAISLIADLHLSNFQYGLGAGLFFAGSAIAQVPSVLAGLYLGPPQWLTFLLLAWGAVSAATAAVKSVAGFYAVRLLLGVFEAGTFGTIWCHMALFYTPDEVLGAPVSAGLLLLDGYGGLRGWQHLFLVLGLVTVAYTLVVALGLARTPSSASFLAPAERVTLQARQDAERQHARLACPAGGRWYAPLRMWALWYLGVAWLLMQATSFAILFWAPLLLDAIMSGRFDAASSPPPPPPRSQHDEALHAAKVAALASVVFVPAAAAMALISLSARHFRERNWHSAVPTALTGVAFMLVPLGVRRGGPVAGIALIVVAAMGAWAVSGPVWSWPAVFVPPHGGARATAIAVFNIFGAVGGFIGPTLLGKLSSAGGDYSTAMFVLGAMDLASAILFLGFRPAPYAEDMAGGVEALHAEQGLGSRRRSDGRQSTGCMRIKIAKPAAGHGSLGRDPGGRPGPHYGRASFRGKHAQRARAEARHWRALHKVADAARVRTAAEALQARADLDALSDWVRNLPSDARGDEAERRAQAAERRAAAAERRARAAEAAAAESRVSVEEQRALLADANAAALTKEHLQRLQVSLEAADFAMRKVAGEMQERVCDGLLRAELLRGRLARAQADLRERTREGAQREGNLQARLAQAQADLAAERALGEELLRDMQHDLRTAKHKAAQRAAEGRARSERLQRSGSTDARLEAGIEQLQAQLAAARAELAKHKAAAAHQAGEAQARLRAVQAAADEQAASGARQAFELQERLDGARNELQAAHEAANAAADAAVRMPSLNSTLLQREELRAAHENAAKAAERARIRLAKAEDALQAACDQLHAKAAALSAESVDAGKARAEAARWQAHAQALENVGREKARLIQQYQGVILRLLPRLGVPSWCWEDLREAWGADELGSGAGGSVLSGMMPDGRPRLAVKGPIWDASPAVPFVREAAHLALCDHPNICRVAGLATYGSMVGIALPRADACLDQWPTATLGPLDADRLLQVMSEIGGALAYLHAQGVAHVDVKLPNILAVFVNTWGTPGYMGPAMLRASSLGGARVDLRADDAHGLGASLWELLTGRQPYAEQTRQLEQMQMTDPDAELWDVQMQVLASFARVLAPDPRDLASLRQAEDALDLVNGLLAHNPAERLRLDELVQRASALQCARPAGASDAQAATVAALERLPAPESAEPAAAASFDPSQWPLATGAERAAAAARRGTARALAAGPPPTVQGALEQVLGVALQEDRDTLRITAAARTDAGVHAVGQVINFYSRVRGAAEGRLLVKANKMLPPDIRITHLQAAPSDFVARYSNTGKEYHFHIHNAVMHDPLTRRTAQHVWQPLDVDLMQRAASLFEGEHDFTQFATLAPGGARNPVKRLTRCAVVPGSGADLRVEVVGDAFLWKMVRHMVGALLFVGRGLLAPSRMEELLKLGSKAPAGRAACRGWDVAEARGLVLQRVLLPSCLDPDRFLYPDLPHDALGRVDVAALQPALDHNGLNVDE
ncbi:hypothetical protein WJX81_001333 [Elliptochloris bilobata]|uniref:Potassium channel SKOR n=1 Tax=Elliptochloris bilobata TaxID=381761 RepID=A0AAW1RDJ1_9CHLO